MAHAAIIACPVFGGSLARVDEQAITGRRGVVRVVKLDDAVAVVADRYWRAKAALDALPIEWNFGAAANADSLDMAMAGAAKVFEATYEAPIISHAQMEPLNCTAHVQQDRVDVWLGTQNADLALQFAAQAAGVKPENVYVHNTYSGGGFGRRLRPDEVTQAVKISKASSTSSRTRPGRTHIGSAGRCSPIARTSSTCSTRSPRRPIGASRCRLARAAALPSTSPTIRSSA
jgi:isoquinoline 1-oxidoreductase subunit beta